MVIFQVPYKTTKAFPINNEFNVPSGSMVIPSFYNSLHDADVYPNPDVFDPERWLAPDSLANKNPKNYLVWGAGPHRCIGVEYASMNIALILATAAVMFDWEHEITDISSRVEYVFLLPLSIWQSLTPSQHSSHLIPRRWMPPEAYPSDPRMKNPFYSGCGNYYNPFCIGIPPSFIIHP